MTTYQSPIILGEKYEDVRTGISGHAVEIDFSENGCVEIDIEYATTDSSDEIKVHKCLVNELRLTHLGGVPLPEETQNYETDIVLGKKYRDIQTGLEGWACIIGFYEHMATRVTLRSTGLDHDGTKVLKHYSIDDFLLEDIETKKVAEPKTEKRSPITREVTRR